MAFSSFQVSLFATTYVILVQSDPIPRDARPLRPGKPREIHDLVTSESRHELIDLEAAETGKRNYLL